MSNIIHYIQVSHISNGYPLKMLKIKRVFILKKQLFTISDLTKMTDLFFNNTLIIIYIYRKCYSKPVHFSKWTSEEKKALQMTRYKKKLLFHVL